MTGPDRNKTKPYWSEINAGPLRVRCLSVNTLIIGSGAASLNAAVRLHEEGQTDIAVVTEQMGRGTSYNSGSDKQTYYKLALSGEKQDSARRMAEDLFAGGCMHGDAALCEAQNSLRSFFHLVECGVPFPHDRYGTYAGYKTDHDPLGRATSAGPRTSRMMVECLAKKAAALGIPVLEGFQVVSLLTEDSGQEKRTVGALALNLRELDTPHFGLTAFNAVNIILGTGGPAGLYQMSVYPPDQYGATGAALAAGAAAQNLTESQFGLASIKFRWNLSGTYQQVIPRYVSTDRNGGDEREFLLDYFPDTGKMATAVFLKGYQWPFDPAKVRNYGSSLIDILVYRERVHKGRRVFLDYTRNPEPVEAGAAFSLDCLSQEAYHYLERSGALQKKPIERLAAMNEPAIDLFMEQGIDLRKEYLEAAVCAQHCNGGIRGNIWWESSVRHLFPVGEVNGSHGVKRPGGSALNSGQVGGLRAAQFIARHYNASPPLPKDFAAGMESCIEKVWKEARNWLEKAAGGTARSWKKLREELQALMTREGGMVRNPAHIADAVLKGRRIYHSIQKEMRIDGPQELPEAFRNKDLGLTQIVFLEAIHEYMGKGGGSRGSFLVLDPEGMDPAPELEKSWRFRIIASGSRTEDILEVRLDKSGRVRKRWVPPRPVPQPDTWFENVWNTYRRHQNIVQEDENDTA